MTDHCDIISNPSASSHEKRSSNIELLRIISVFLICLTHFCGFSGFQWSSLTPGLYTIQCMSLGGRMGVNVFILITGYFLVNKSFSGKKVIRLYMEVFFYSISLCLLTSLVFGENMTAQDWHMALMPISSNKYWFATAYITLYLFVPFLNLFIRALSKKMHFCLICVCVGIWTIGFLITQSNANYSDFLWFILLYFVGAYIRLYPPHHFTGCLPNLACVFALCLLAFVNIYLSNNISSGYLLNVTSFYRLDHYFTFFTALFLFLAFLNLRIPYLKWINIVASASLGIYLIQENFWFRKYLWSELLSSAKFQESPFLIPYAIGVALLVYFVFTLIDLMRQFFLEKPLMKFIDRFGPTISAPFLRIWTRIRRKIWFDKNDVLE